MIWMVLIFFIYLFSTCQSQVEFIKCRKSSNLSICQNLDLEEEIPPGRVIDTFTFVDPSTDKLSFTIETNVTDIEGVQFLSLINKYFEFDLVVSSRIDKEDFILNNRSFNFNIKINGSDFVIYHFNVNLLDIDDNFPIFKNDFNSCNLKENDPDAYCQGFVVYDYDEVSDFCQLDVVHSSGGSNKDFTATVILSKREKLGYVHTFKISLNRPIDYEEYPKIQLGIQAKDNASHTSIFYLTLIVENVKETVLEFVNLPYFITIEEEMLPGSSVSTVKAIDKENILERNIKYKLKSANQTIYRFFDVNSKTGLITISKRIDRESPEISEKFGFINLTVVATITDQNISSEANVIIQIKDINDSPASFNYQTYQGTIMENSEPGIPVYTEHVIHISDTDFGDFAKYSLEVYEDNKISKNFVVIPANVTKEAILLLKVKDGSKLDYESQTIINVTIRAQQLAPAISISSYSSANLIIKILNINDNWPVFGNSYYTFTILENSPFLTPVGEVKATDRDKHNFGVVKYELNDPYNKFSINNLSGLIYVNINADQDKRLLDREVYEAYNMSVIATDGGGIMTSARVKIILKDVNDNSPKFERRIYETWIKENDPFFQPPLIVRAIDNDKDRLYNRVEYRIEKLNKESIDYSKNIRINTTSGNITLISPLDREMIPNGFLEIVIIAFDVNIKSYSDTCLVQIHVLGINDNVPSLSAKIYTAKIPQNYPFNKTILFVNSTDIDEGNSYQSDIIYGLFGSDSERFTIKKKTQNEVAFIERNIFPLEAKIYNFIIKVFNSMNPEMSSSASVIITVTGVNNQSPYFNEIQYKYYIFENVTSGTKIGTISATDPDANAILEYSIVQNSIKSWNSDNILVGSINNLMGVVEVNRSTGDLSIQSELDYEKFVRIKLKVQVEDTAADKNYQNQRAYTVVEINIDDVNDNFPQFSSSPFNMTLRENFGVSGSLYVATDSFINAIDIDKSDILNYTITDHSGTFTIDSKSGRIIQLKSLDREMTSFYNFTVQCSDGKHWANSDVIVTVLDINDNRPRFLDNVNIINVREKAQPGDEIAKFEAEDKDEGENGCIKMSMKCSFNDAFRLNAKGSLILEKPIFTLSQNIYNITIEISDCSFPEPPLKDSKNVRIVLPVINQHYPKFDKNLYEFDSIKETETIGYKIGQIHVSDKDFGDNIKYELTMPNQTMNRLFKVQHKNGDAQILVDSNLRGKRGKYIMYLKATDNGNPKLSNKCIMIITIEDVNEYSPTFMNTVKTETNSEMFIFKIKENSKGFISKIKAYDNDTGNNGKFFFSLASQNQDHYYFHIDQVNGLLENREKFDKEIKDTYTFQILAYDLAYHSRTSTVNVRVEILDEDDNMPLFPIEKKLITFETKEGKKDFIKINNFLRGFKIGTIPEAIDIDKGVIAYIIIENTSMVYLHPFSRDLYGLKEFDRELNDSLTFTIRAIPESQYKKGSYKNPNSPVPVNSEATLLLIIEDENDNPPQFVLNQISVQLILTKPTNSLIINLSKYVTDRDLKKSNSFLFSIVKNDSFLPAQWFWEYLHLERETGILFVGPELFYLDSLPDYIQLEINVSDGKYNDTAQCIIYLVDSQHMSIIFSNDSQENSLKETNTILQRLSNKMKVNVSIDYVKFVNQTNGNVQKTFTAIYVHAIDLVLKRIIPTEDLRKVIIENEKNNDNFLQKSKIVPVKSEKLNQSMFKGNLKTYKLILIILVSTFLLFMIVIVIGLSICRSYYFAKLKAYGTLSMRNSKNLNSVKYPELKIYKNAMNSRTKKTVEPPSINIDENIRINYRQGIGVPVFGHHEKFSIELLEKRNDLCEINETAF